MNTKVTTIKISYPEFQGPDWSNPTDYMPYRFGLGKTGSNPLVAIGMNPSAANNSTSDRTVNKIIKISQRFGYDGWAVFNTYPERATDAKNITKIDKTLIEQNITIIKEFLLSNEIKEIWGAWGDLKYDPLIRGRDEIITMLKQNNIKIFHFSSLTKNGNPRHPLYLKIELQNKNYMEI